jgi:hypothetical protein
VLSGAAVGRRRGRGARDEARADELALAIVAIAQREHGAQGVRLADGVGAGRLHTSMIDSGPDDL